MVYICLIKVMVYEIRHRTGGCRADRSWMAPPRQLHHSPRPHIGLV